MISNVSFKAGGVFDAVNPTKPQTFVSPNPVQPNSSAKPAKKNHKAAKVIAGILGTAVAAAALLAVGKHFNVFSADKVAKLTEKLEGKKLLSWAKKPIEVVSKGLDAAGGWCLNAGKTVKNAVVGLFRKPEAVANENVL